MPVTWEDQMGSISQQNPIWTNASCARLESVITLHNDQDLIHMSVSRPLHIHAKYEW